MKGCFTLAKDKFDKYTQYDIIGTLDKNEDEKLILIADGMEYDFVEEIAENMLGQQVQIKCQVDC